MQLQYGHAATSHHYHCPTRSMCLLPLSVSTGTITISAPPQNLLLYFQLKFKFASVLVGWGFFPPNQFILQGTDLFLKHSLLLKGYMLIAYCSYYILYLYYYAGNRQANPKLCWLKSPRPHWHEGSPMQHRMGPCSQVLLQYCLGNKMGKKEEENWRPK